MAETVTHMSSHMDLQGNSAVTVVTDAGRVHVHYRHLKEWVELPPVPGTVADGRHQRAKVEVAQWYEAGYKCGQHDRKHELHMSIIDFERQPDPWREGYDDGRKNNPHKYTKEVSTK